MTTIAIACDHAGPEAKTWVTEELKKLGFSVTDFGTDGSASVDYPDYADKVVEAIAEGSADMGVLICGSGIGMSMAANRHRMVRAALVHNEETASLSRQHNNANIIVLGARQLDEATIRACTKTFFTTQFEGDRHQKRIAKFS